MALRLLAARPALASAAQTRHALTVTRFARHDRVRLAQQLRQLVANAVWLLDAVCYFLPVTSAIGILASHPPERELQATLRLPFPIVTVWFAADLEFDPRFLRWSAMLDEPDRQFAAHAVTAAAGLPARTKAEADLTSAVCDLGGYLTGITLFATEAGGSCDGAVAPAVREPPAGRLSP